MKTKRIKARIVWAGRYTYHDPLIVFDAEKVLPTDRPLALIPIDDYPALVEQTAEVLAGQNCNMGWDQYTSVEKHLHILDARAVLRSLGIVETKKKGLP
ncbi:MAG: hypothetical protein WC655_13530 [Candidatus Hydrogenedentales bacterium]